MLGFVLGAGGKQCWKLHLCPQGADSLLKNKRNDKAMTIELIRVINNRRNTGESESPDEHSLTQTYRAMGGFPEEVTWKLALGR